jgi:hypothetical protein
MSVKKAETLLAWEGDRIVLMHLPILVRGMLVELLLLFSSCWRYTHCFVCFGHTSPVSSSLDDDDSYSDGTKFPTFLSLFHLLASSCIPSWLAFVSPTSFEPSFFFFRRGCSFFLLHSWIPLSCTYICSAFSSFASSELIRVLLVRLALGLLQITFFNSYLHFCSCFLFDKTTVESCISPSFLICRYSRFEGEDLLLQSLKS